MITEKEAKRHTVLKAKHDLGMLTESEYNEFLILAEKFQCDLEDNGYAPMRESRKARLRERDEDRIEREVQRRLREEREAEEHGESVASAAIKVGGAAAAGWIFGKLIS